MRETASIRVVHVAPTAFGSAGLFGGGERYPLELARALAREDGVDCELVTFGDHPRLEHDPSGLRVRVLRPLVRLRRHPAHPIALGLGRVVANADIVHTHHLRSAPSRVAALAARGRGRWLVTTDHGLGGGGWCGLLPRLFHRFLTVSRYSAETLGGPESKTTVIYGGADPDRFCPEPSAARAGIVFVGRLTPHKGVDRLIQAVPPGVELTVVGTTGHDLGHPERDYPDRLRHLAAARNVRFVGAAAEDRLPSLYRHASVFALPSVDRTCYGRPVAISELLGLSVLEAMASATPVVASRVGGVPEIVVDGETGLLVPAGDVGALHDALATVLGDDRLARRLGENGRALVREHFNWQACARRCLAAYRDLVK
jgi:glycosyltransferase involved in cell wall biosynthesis